ncbi:MAG: hypothetical protein ACRDK5_04885 [Solirubrobacterales bacterium]
MSADRQAIVVSFAGDDPFSPRVQRAAHLATALERQFDFRVERVPGQPGHAMGRFNATLPRRVARRAVGPLVLDSFEIPARLTLRGWKPSGRGALLVGWPFSPIYVAASHLLAAGVPYVVDVGDPWALTEPAPSPRFPRSRLLAWRRAKAAEAFLWRHAAAGVVTTESQASSLRALFPDLNLLCRPNGYTPTAESVVQREPAHAASAGELRLVQFGSVNPAKLPIGGWLSRLRGAAGLTSVRFVNYGSVDRPELLQTQDPAVVVEIHDPVDWGRACRIARGFDAAVVVANRNPAELPSKSIQYLTLPVPRIAVTASRDPGELGAFAAQRPGFIAIDVDSREDIPRLIAHLRRAWSDEELSPPAGDSWAEVAREVVGFAIEAWDRTRAVGRLDHGEHVATAPEQRAGPLASRRGGS